jgi:hypothetical protein
MSTPPDQPSASPYPPSPPSQPAPPSPLPPLSPQPPAAQPGPPAPEVGGYGTPVPAQHNPYAQASPYAPQAYYGPGLQPPGATPPGSRRGGAGRAVLWAAVGAAVASALWGGGVFLLGGSDSPDLRGYTVKSDLCEAADLSAFKTKYPQDDDDPTHNTIRGEAVDDMACDEGLEMSGSSSSDAYLSINVSLHKKTDPAPEFTDTWLGYKQRHDSDYSVTEVDGFGDEAYLLTEDTVSSESGSRYVTLAVRDGWLTYSMSWSVYVSSYDSDEEDAPTVSEAAKWVKAATTATLAKLRES